MTPEKLSQIIEPMLDDIDRIGDQHDIYIMVEVNQVVHELIPGIEIPVGNPKYPTYVAQLRVCKGDSPKEPLYLYSCSLEDIPDKLHDIIDNPEKYVQSF